MTYLLDTSTCIFALNSERQVVDAMRRNRDKGVCISTITLGELEYGVFNSKYQESNRNRLQSFAPLIQCLEFDTYAAHQYGRLRADLKRSGCLIGHLDMLIAAHAMSRALILVTNNVKEFSRIDGLEVVDWSL